MTKRFTGWHMAAILVGGFAVVVAVNLLMASAAVGTFGGVVVENSYVASQRFNGWLREAEAQNALGWSADMARNDAGLLEVVTQGTPAELEAVAELRHPLGREKGRTWTLLAQGDGRFASREILPTGRWIVRLTLMSGDEVVRIEEHVR